MGIRGTLPPLDSYGGTGGAPPVVVTSLPGIDHVIFVDEAPVTGAEDGTIQNPYHSLDDGMSSVNYVRVVGTSRRAVVIYSDSKILVVDDIYTSYWNLTFETTTNEMPVQIDAAAGARIEFHECGFVSTVGTLSYVEVINSADVLFKDCVFSGGATNALRLAGALPTVELNGCRVAGDILQYEGDLNIQYCTLMGRVAQNTDPGDLTIEHSRITPAVSHAIALITAAADVIIRHNIIEVTGSSYCVQSGGEALSQARIEDNLMVGGIDPNVGVLGGTVKVGQAGDYDYYRSVVAALQANPDTRNLIVEMLVDVVETSSDSIQAEKVTVRLNGHKLSRGSRDEILRAPAGGELVVEGPGEVEATLAVTGSGILRLSDVHLDGQVFIASGFEGVCEIDVCTVAPEFSVTNSAALLVEGDAGIISIKHSYLKGVPGDDHPAVYYLTNTNDEVHARHTTFVNADETNAAFGRSGAQTPDITLHNCGDVAALPAWLTNLIAVGQEFNTVDGNVVFD